MTKTAKQPTARLETAPDPAEEARQIAEKAARTRTEIGDQVRAAQDTLTRLQAERADVLAAQEQQTNALQQCEQQAIAAAHKAEQAHAYASMADGTVGAQKALSDALQAQREAEQAQARLQNERTTAAEQNQQTDERLAALAAQIAREQSIIAQAGPRLQEIAQVEDQALRELGESLHSAFLAELDQHDSTVAAARKTLTSAQMDRQAFLSRAIPQMGRWPDLAEDLKAALPGVNDPTARILRAAIAFHDQLCADRRELRSGLMESAETRHMENWWKLLLFDGLFIHQPFNTGADHQMLRLRRDQLARILADYECAHR